MWPKLILWWPEFQICNMMDEYRFYISKIWRNYFLFKKWSLATFWRIKTGHPASNWNFGHQNAKTGKVQWPLSDLHYGWTNIYIISVTFVPWIFCSQNVFLSIFSPVIFVIKWSFYSCPRLYLHSLRPTRHSFTATRLPVHIRKLIQSYQLWHHTIVVILRTSKRPQIIGRQDMRLVPTLN